MRAQPFLVLVGLLALAGGLVLLNAPAETLKWGPRGPLERHVGNPVEALAGLALAFVSAAFVVWLTRRTSATNNPPSSAVAEPPVVAPRPRRGVVTFAVLAAVCGLTVGGCLAAGVYVHGLLIVFAAAIMFAALTLRAADRRQRRPTGLRAADLGVALGVVAVTAWLHARGSDHWLFTSIGDEMPFFEMAKAIAAGEAVWNGFDVVGGVYGSHSFLDSAYHALWMKALGPHVRAWRFALAFAAGMSAALLYLAGIVLRGRVVGLVAAAALGSSHYLMAFSHIGYNNSHAVFYNVLAAFALALAWRTGRWHHHWLAGAALGLGLYTFLAAAAFWIVAGLVLVWETLLRRAARHRAALGFAALGFSAAVAPALQVTTHARLTDAVAKNSVVLLESHHGGQDITRLRMDAGVRSVLALWHTELITGHHLGGRWVDPVTGALLILGFSVALVGLRRGFLERLTFVWLVAGFLVVIVSHYEETPSTSRSLVLLAPIALACGLGVDRLASLADRHRVRIGMTLALASWTVLPMLNVHQLFVISPRKMVPKRVVMVMKALQEHPGHDVIDVAVGFDGDIPGILAAYPWLERRYRFLSELELIRGDGPATADRPIFYVDPSSEHLADVLQARLPAHYRRIEDRDPTGGYRVFLFLPGP